MGLVLGGHNSGSFGLIACAVGPFGLPKWPISPTGNRRAPTAAGHGHILKCCTQSVILSGVSLHFCLGCAEPMIIGYDLHKTAEMATNW